MINRKGRKLILIALTVAVCVMTCASAFAADSIFPDFQPDLGEYTPMPELTPVTAESPEPTHRHSTKESPVLKSEQSDTLYIYAPEGVVLYFYQYDAGNDVFNALQITGNGSSSPAFSIKYSAFLDYKADTFPIIEYPQFGGIESNYRVVLSKKFNVLIPEFRNDYSAYDSGTAFVVSAMNFGSALYVNIVDSSGGLVEVEDPTPMPTPVESVSVPELEQGREIMDIVSINNGVRFMGKLFELVYDLFPYYVMIMAICVFMLIIQIVVR